MGQRIGAFFKQGWNNQRVNAGRLFLRKYGLVIGISLVVIYLAGAWLYSQGWTGFQATGTAPAKTLWDWLDLLIVPIVLGVGAYLFNRRAALRDTEREEAVKEHERAREEAAHQEEILQDYLDDMSQLLMEKKLKEALKKRNSIPTSRSDEESKTGTQVEEELPVVDVARARTISTLRRLKNPQRRNELLDFLGDAGLYKGETSLLRGAKVDGINLEQTNLREIDLSGAHLAEANLSGADLRKANLVGADLGDSRLEGADLGEANLEGAYLRRANLEQAHLEKVNLREGYLRGANLKSSTLRNANLMGAQMYEANLKGADFGQANLSGADLRGGIFDNETRLPDRNFWHEGVDWTQWTKPNEDEIKT